LKKKTTPDSAAAPLQLAPNLSIADAANLHRELTERVSGGVPLVIDGSRVEQIDTAILQLLVSCWRTCTQRGVACGWQAASENLRRSALLIGVADLLQLSAV
jgi:anti-anti-sigma regulatory factor